MSPRDRILAAAVTTAAACRVSSAAVVVPEAGEGGKPRPVRLYARVGPEAANLARILGKKTGRGVLLTDLASLPYWHPDHGRLVWLTRGPRPPTLCPQGFQIEGSAELPGHFFPTPAKVPPPRRPTPHWFPPPPAPAAA